MSALRRVPADCARGDRARQYLRWPRPVKDRCGLIVIVSPIDMVIILAVVSVSIVGLAHALWNKWRPK